MIFNIIFVVLRENIFFYFFYINLYKMNYIYVKKKKKNFILMT